MMIVTAFLSAACGGSTQVELPASATSSTGSGATESGVAETAGSGDNAATSLPGAAVIPRDLCQEEGQLVTNVLSVDDLRDAGIDWTEAFVGSAVDSLNSVGNYPENGKVLCGATFGVNGGFDFVSIDLLRDGDDLANRYDVREIRGVAGQTLTIYDRNGNSERKMVAEATFADPDSRVGTSSLIFSVENDLSDDDAAALLARIADIVLPQVSFEPPAAVADPAQETEAPTADPSPTALVPDWWFGCDSDNFAIEGFSASTVFAALGEQPATDVQLSDNPLGAGLLTDCRAGNGTSRIYVIAVPPLAGLLESVDDVAGSEANATVQDIAGRRAVVWTETDSVWDIGKVHVDLEGFTLEIHAEDREGRNLNEQELKQLAVTAAETFLAQI